VSGIEAKALIMVVSRPEAVEIAAEKVLPERIGVIVSQEVLEPVIQRCIGLRDRAVFTYKIVDSPMEIGDSFDRFENLLSDMYGAGYSSEHTLLDATGGTTPMRLGAALAAMTRGIRMVHQRVPQRFVDGKWELDKSREIDVVPMHNPLESTGLLREGQAVELFNRRDYGAAALVFGDIVGKVDNVERRHYYSGLLLLAEGYGAWDVADYGTALGKLQSAKKELGTPFDEGGLRERAVPLVERVVANLSFLGDVRGKLSVENVVDMVQNARRRIVDQGRYDDGVARLYRAIEMWHQWRLRKKHSIATEKVDWTRIDESTCEEFMASTGLEQLPETLDLTRARTLDLILDQHQTEDDNVLRDLLQKRNNSILAHGLEPIEEGSAKRFLDYVDEMVKRPDIKDRAGHARLREL
jgi:CRISPR-associated protein (TIGR02710 family)